MPNSQSNKQTQNVKVIVNNRIDSKCCDDKKKRKPKKRQPPPPPPEVINEFPALATPPSRANTSIPNISPIAVRNVVYPAQTVQISPEGDAPPVPAYFEKHYTNLVRTIEDMRTSIVNEMRAKAQVLPDPMPPDAPNRPMPIHPGYAEYQPENQPDFYVPNEEPFVLPTPPEQPALETQKTPTKQLIKQFEEMSIDRDAASSSSSKKSPMSERSIRESLNKQNVEQLQERYYLLRPGGKPPGPMLKNKARLINRIIDLLKNT